MTKDTEPASSASREPLSDPPTYASSEDQPEQEKLLRIVNRVIPRGPSGWQPDQLEDARRELALLCPTTDVPHVQRINEANEWVHEYNTWSADTKRSYGCATHDCNIPALLDPVVVCDAIASGRSAPVKLMTSPERKETAARAIFRASKLVYEELEDNVHTQVRRAEARVLMESSKEAAALYKALAPRLEFRKSFRDKLSQDWIDVTTMEYLARVLTVTSASFVVYQLEIARLGPQEVTSTALAKAIQSLAVSVTAAQTWETACKEVDRIFHLRRPKMVPEVKKVTKVEKLRNWVAKLFCLNSRISNS